MAVALDDDGGQPSVIHVTGEIDIANADELAETIAKCAPAVIDLTDVTYIDSSGVAVLILASNRAARAGVRMDIAGVHGHVRRIFELAGIDYLLGDAEPSDGYLCSGCHTVHSRRDELPTTIVGLHFCSDACLTRWRDNRRPRG